MIALSFCQSKIARNPGLIVIYMYNCHETINDMFKSSILLGK